jgi:ectoine hydroxylase-related dioxygenase (phytanoyl-CoA dioxygenase family)
VTADTSLALQEWSASAPFEDLLAALEVDGAVVVRDFLDVDIVTALRAELTIAADGRQVGTKTPSVALQRFWGEQTMRFTQLPRRCPAFHHVLTHPTFLTVADALLLPHCTSYWLNTGQAIALAPGQPAQHLHRDADNWWRVNRTDGPEVTLSCMLAVDEFTRDNGATRVVPGSHNWHDYSVEPGPSDAVVDATMPAGSALLYTGRVLHGGGENRSDAWRWGLHASFVLGWLTPEEAVPLGIKPDTIAQQSDRVQQLLGWRSSTLSDGGGRLWTLDYEDIATSLDTA